MHHLDDQSVELDSIIEFQKKIKTERKKHMLGCDVHGSSTAGLSTDT